jgi:beta-1,4-mannosyl-glycoprotein beta-1,4-N-acetylglucosaminyltransferase
MNIYDCFTYNNEDLILDIRLNYLNKYVKKFVIIEAKFTHQGKEKKTFLDLNKFQKFKDKIVHLFIEDFPLKSSNWERENFQRDYISRGITNAQGDDFIMISDIDEIPNKKKLKDCSNFKYTVFGQKNFSYKFNLINKTFPLWYGTRICKKKYLKTPQWLRNQKIKKNFFLKYFRFNWNIVENGGWHFSYLMRPNQIRDKIMSFGHAEFNYEKYTSLEKISEKIGNNQDLYDRNQFYEKVDLDNSFPLIIHENKNRLKEWIL